MKITTWNVNSVNARIEHLIKFIKKDQSDLYLIQELKCTNENFPKEELENINYKCYVNGQKAWNGVAILSKESIEISNLKIPNYQDVNSRFIETEISLKNIKNKIKLINIYLPNGNPIETEKFDYKIDWMINFNKYIKELIDNNQPVIIGGDFNVIPSDEDVYSPENFKKYTKHFSTTILPNNQENDGTRGTMEHAAPGKGGRVDYSTYASTF